MSSGMSEKGPSRKAIIGWTFVMLGTLALVFFATELVIPTWRIRREVEVCSWGSGRYENLWDFTDEAIGKLGGHRRVVRALRIYRLLPKRFAPHENVAALMLCRCGPAAVEDVIALLKHEDELVRYRAVEALGTMGDHRAVLPLCSVLDDEKLLYQAAGSLAKMPDPRAIGPLVAKLSTRDASTRHHVESALAAIGEPAAKALIAALEEEDEYAREGAAETLGDIGAAEAVVPLGKLLRGEKSAAARDAAAKALAAIGGAGVDELLDVLKKQPEDWHAARLTVTVCYAVAGIKERRAVELLIPLLKRDDVGVSDEAARALGLIGDRRAVEPLIENLDRDWRDRLAAAWALGELGDPRAIEPIRAMMARQDMKEGYEDQVRSAAETALEEIEKANGGGK